MVRILLSQREPVVLVASAEFALKSYPVRRTLEQRLIDDLRVALARAGFEGFTVEKHAARLVVHGLSVSASAVAAQCFAKVFGVAYAVPATLLPSSMEIVLQEIVHIAQASLRPGQSFAIRCHSPIPNSLHSREIEISGGSEVLRAMKEGGVRVDLKKPDVTISVDLAGDRVYAYGNRLQGPGGLPLSSQWKMLAVLDSGSLGILAAYAMMRRGCMVELLIPISETIPTFREDRQLELAGRLRALVTRQAYKAYVISIEPYQDQGSHNPAELRWHIRKAALRVAREKRFRGIIFSDVTGELNLDYQTNQTPDNNLLSPIFYPLLGLETGDLVEMCNAIGITPDELFSQIRLENESHKHNVSIVERADNLAVEELQL